MKIVWRDHVIIRCMVWLWHTFSWLCTKTTARWSFTFFIILRSFPFVCRIAFNKPRLSWNKNVQRLIAYTVIIRFLCQRRNDGVTNIEIYYQYKTYTKKFKPKKAFWGGIRSVDQIVSAWFCTLIHIPNQSHNNRHLQYLLVTSSLY